MKNTRFMSVLLGGMVLGGAWAYADAVRPVVIDELGRGTRYLGSEFRVDEATGTGKVLLKLEERIGGPRVCHPRGGIVIGAHPWFPGRGPGPGFGHPPVVDCGPEYRMLERTVSVRGLTYDAPSSRILFADREGHKTVCASVSQRYARITHRPYLSIVPTGACRAFGVANVGNGTTSIFFEAN
jgi:hypothetical protein